MPRNAKRIGAHGGVRTTEKPVLNCHTKIDKTKILMTNGSLMKVQSIGECNIFDLH